MRSNRAEADAAARISALQEQLRVLQSQTTVRAGYVCVHKISFFPSRYAHAEFLSPLLFDPYS